MSAVTPCHVCEQPTDDACNRCERATCDEHFWDQEYLGLCQVCHHEVQALIEEHGALTNWPYPVRKLKPEWQAPAGTASSPIDPSD